MNKKDESMLMEKYGITCLTKTIYHYQGYSYEKLNDALKYADIDSNRNTTRVPERANGSTK